jgi:hypothetical protein
MKSETTRRSKTSSRERLLRLPRPRMSLTPLALLVSLLVVHGVLAFSAEPVATPALSPASVLSSVAQEAKVVYAQGERLAANLRLVYEIRSFLAETDKEAKENASSVKAVDAKTNTCSLSAAGLNNRWKR